MKLVRIMSAFALGLGSIVSTDGQASPDSPVFTLYRSSVLNSAARIHVATFDAADGGTYNHENCNAAADLFQHQEGVRTRFWCEGGRYRP